MSCLFLSYLNLCSGSRISGGNSKSQAWTARPGTIRPQPTSLTSSRAMACPYSSSLHSSHTELFYSVAKDPRSLFLLGCSQLLPVDERLLFFFPLKLYSSCSFRLRCHVLSCACMTWVGLYLFLLLPQLYCAHPFKCFLHGVGHQPYGLIGTGFFPVSRAHSHVCLVSHCAPWV